MSDTQEIMMDFLAEVEGYLPKMRSCLADLHQDTGHKQALEELHRITHTIKGAAAMVGLEDLSKTGGLLEELLDEIFDHSRRMDETLLDFFKESTARITQYCSLKREGQESSIFEETSDAFAAKEANRTGLAQGSTDSIAAILDQLLSTEVEEDFFLLDESVEGAEEEAETTGIDPELLECFTEESAEHLESINLCLRRLRVAVPHTVDLSPRLREELHLLRQAVHTLKGAAAVIGIAPVAAWGGDFEDCLDQLHDEAQTLDPETLVALQKGYTMLARLTQEPQTTPALLTEQRAIVALFQRNQEQGGLLEELFGETSEAEVLQAADDFEEGELFVQDSEVPPIDLAAELEESTVFADLAAEEEAGDFLFTEDEDSEAAEDIFSSLPEEVPLIKEQEAEEETASPAIDPELLECFTEEAEEHLSQIDIELNQLAAVVPQQVAISPPMREHLHVLRRSVHTLKGAAAVIGIAPVAAWGHDFEDFLDWLHDEAQTLDPDVIQALRQGNDLIAQITEQPHLAREQEKEDLKALFRHIITQQQVEAASPIEETLAAVVEEESTVFADLAAEEEASDFLFTEDEDSEAAEEEDAALPEEQEVASPAIDPELLECFTEEAEEHLGQIDTELNQLAAAVPQQVAISPPMREHLHVLRRAVHTLKGAAAVIGIAPVAAWGHDFEDFLDWLHDEAQTLDPDIIQALRQGNDLIAKITENPDLDLSEKKADTIALFQQFMALAPVEAPALAELEPLPQPEVLPQAEPAPAPQEASPRRKVSTLRVDVNKIDQVVGLSGDMVINLSSFESSMLAMSNTLNELGMILQRLKNINHSLEAGYELASIPYLAGMSDTGTGGLAEDFDPLELDRYSELNILIRSLSEAVSDLDSIMSQSSLENIAWQKTVERQARVLKEIQNRMIGIRMTPLSILSSRMQRTVREAERSTGHTAELVLEGESIMMDTRVWDTMADPLMHILRNAVAHGGSPAQQDLTIRIKAIRQGGLFMLRINDNGKGLDYEAIRKKAMKLYPTEGIERMRQDQLAALIFRHGFSSTSAVSNIAGRGVGMDVVREAVEQLNGSIQIHSEPGQGLELLIRLPVAVAQLHVVLLRLVGQVYAVPMHDIESVVRIHAQDLVDTTEYRTAEGESLPLLLPANIPGFHIGANDFVPAENDQALLLVHGGNYRAALLCDQIIGQRDVVFKDLGTHLSRVPCIAGVTIMGDGRLIPILQTEDLLKKWYELSQAKPLLDEEVAREKPEARPLQILVVDDSISVRKVVSNFILQQGWQPIAARNGIEALERIREEKPDFVLLDVEMPRMNGFEVLQSLQSQPDFRDIPVAMLTSRSAEKYRERARQLGAQGFITKPFKAEEIFELIQGLTSEKEHA